ncbi:SMR family transporter [Mobilicoccus sp.]|uniref:DMT family transporter n=1 Tax=Mobilicoccus sp. TaxID=2034349 RepID=UPI00289BA8CA|nr:SMR family transporter [Mobilicoccus sp.]
MTRWIFLAGAIASEVTGSLSLKAAIDQPAWYALVAAGFILAFVCLAGALRYGMPLGVGYGIWGACGVSLTAILSAVIFDEPLTGLMLGGIAAVIAGVLCIELGAHPTAPAPSTSTDAAGA